MKVCVICGITESYGWYTGPTCKGCYQRGGKPPKPKLTPNELFWQRVSKTDACWNWLPGNRTFTYYNPKKITISARRYSYQLHNGPIPDDRYIIHLCKNNLCVNPAHLQIELSEEERFWSKVTKLSAAQGGCWIWIGLIDPGGYGVFRQQGKHSSVRAHRYSWELANKHTIKSPRLFVCHKCDVTYCVNPDHLFLGEALDNNRDCAAKKRHCYGSNNAQAKLTEEKVREILNSNLSYGQLAKKFSVSKQSIRRIKIGQSWKHVSANLG